MPKQPVGGGKTAAKPFDEAKGSVGGTGGMGNKDQREQSTPATVKSAASAGTQPKRDQQLPSLDPPPPPPPAQQLLDEFASLPELSRQLLSRFLAELKGIPTKQRLARIREVVDDAPFAHSAADFEKSDNLQCMLAEVGEKGWRAYFEELVEKLPNVEEVPLLANHKRAQFFEQNFDKPENFLDFLLEIITVMRDPFVWGQNPCLGPKWLATFIARLKKKFKKGADVVWGTSVQELETSFADIVAWTEEVSEWGGRFAGYFLLELNMTTSIHDKGIIVVDRKSGQARIIIPSCNSGASGGGVLCFFQDDIELAGLVRKSSEGACILTYDIRDSQCAFWEYLDGKIAKLRGACVKNGLILPTEALKSVFLHQKNELDNFDADAFRAAERAKRTGESPRAATTEEQAKKTMLAKEKRRLNQRRILLSSASVTTEMEAAVVEETKSLYEVRVGTQEEKAELQAVFLSHNRRVADLNGKTQEAADAVSEQKKKIRQEVEEELGPILKPQKPQKETGDSKGSKPASNRKLKGMTGFVAGRNKAAGKHDVDGAMHHCDTCGKGFDTNDKLYIHQDVHRNQSRRECNREGCEAVCHDAKQLKAHEEWHDGIRLFSCKEEDCWAAFTKKQGLTEHMNMVHCDPVQCLKCDVWLSNEKSYKGHMARHEAKEAGEKHACEEENCDKTFGNVMQLREHKSTHTKPAACEAPGCGKRFMDQRELRRHARRHES